MNKYWVCTNILYKQKLFWKKLRNFYKYLFFGFAYIIGIVIITECISCQRIKTPKGTPNCINKKIRQMKKEKCPSVQNVYRYTYKDNFVFVFIPKNCGTDLQTQIFSEDCNLICTLSGIGGLTDCNGDNFFQTATQEVLLYGDGN